MPHRPHKALVGMVVAVAAAAVLLARGPAPDAPAVPPPGPESATSPDAQAHPAVPPLHDHVNAGDQPGGTGVDPQALQVAEDFAQVWSAPHGQWHARVSALTTAELSAALAGAEPVHPPPRVESAATTLAAAPEWTRVRVPTDRGDLMLDLVTRDGRWRVSAVDWRRW